MEYRAESRASLHRSGNFIIRGLLVHRCALQRQTLLLRLRTVSPRSLPPSEVPMLFPLFETIRANTRPYAMVISVAGHCWLPGLNSRHLRFGGSIDPPEIIFVTSTRNLLRRFCIDSFFSTRGRRFLGRRNYYYFEGYAWFPFRGKFF